MKTIKIAVGLFAFLLIASTMAAALEVNTNLGSDLSLNKNSDDSGSRGKGKVNAEVRLQDSKGKGSNDNSEKEIARVNQLANLDLGLFNSANIDQKLLEIDRSLGINARENSFAKVNLGEGWITNSTYGKFVSILWVEKTYVNGTNSTNENMTARGTLKISGKNAYSLKLVSSTDDKLVFDVKTNGNEKANGTLKLDSVTSLPGFEVWKGELTIGSKTYDVSVATRENRVAGISNTEVKTKTHVSIEGDVDPSSTLQSLIKTLKSSFDNSNTAVKLFASAVNNGGNVSLESKAEGNLTAEQEQTWNDIKDELSNTVESAENGSKLSITIESEVKSKKEPPKYGFWKKFVSKFNRD